uniref:Agglutinin C-terminal domain-containing protein n=1 Tax=viral metagenome TaxID=1070528 RepID=A0A6M3L7B7_9ZZZZ
MCLDIFKWKKSAPIEPPPIQVVTPQIKPCGLMDYGRMDAIIRAELERLVDINYNIYLPDAQCKVYKQADVIAYSGLNEVSSIPFVSEEHDCDDFAAKLYGKFAGLIWTTLHAFNWFVDDADTLWYIEPQTKKISQTIDGWQGTDVRFFLGR